MTRFLQQLGEPWEKMHQGICAFFVFEVVRDKTFLGQGNDVRLEMLNTAAS